MGAYIIVGGQWGDEAKGLISAYVSARENAKFVARAGTGPNAEHGIFLEDEKTYLKCNQLPLGWIFNPDVSIMIGSGVAVNPGWLLKEIEMYNLWDRVFVDYRCPIVTNEHIEKERTSKGMSAIGSTMSGTGECRKDFIARIAKQAKDIPELESMVCDVGKGINKAAILGDVVVESSQGTFLSLAFSPDYPNVTSDNVTAMAAADDVLLSWKNIKDVILVVKTKPTREGAGDMGRGRELPEEEIVKRGLVEISSIEGKIRRKSEFDFDMIKEAVEVNGATQIALTFMDHAFPEMKGAKSRGQITREAWDFIQKVEKQAGVPVTILNTGKAYNNIIDISFNPKTFDWDKVAKTVKKHSGRVAK